MGRGFSVLYNKRYLYSRYNPEAASVKLAESVTILPQTLVLVFSPLLGYGLPQLLERLPEDSTLVLIEADPALFKLSSEYLLPIIKDRKNVHNICIANGSAFFSLFSRNVLPSFSHYKRCLPVELSGGVQLYKQFYYSLIALADNAINQFWRNRITLVQLGRLYARNIFKNIGQLPFSKPLIASSVFHPVVVCGSGPSLEKSMEFLKKCADECYVIAVDNALMPLVKNGVFPDVIVAVESQLAIEKAYIGSAGTRTPVIADLTSRPHVLELTGGEAAFFLSEYEQCNYLERIKDAFNCPVIPPLGSVGLAAMELALFLRHDETVPIFFSGLDFSFKPCKTHCKETPSHRKLLDAHNRLNPLFRGESSFGPNSYYFAGKDGTATLTTPSLSGYGRTFSVRYGHVSNLFDISLEGMDTGAERKSLESAMEMVQCFSQNNISQVIAAEENQFYSVEKVKDFLLSEKSSLEELKNILITGKKSDKIVPLLKDREYLYLHFPDGYKGPSSDLSFLNRVRAEIDFFIKDITFSLNVIDKKSKNKAE